jgi:hypothetical protein
VFQGCGEVEIPAPIYELHVTTLTGFTFSWNM